MVKGKDMHATPLEPAMPENSPSRPAESTENMRLPESRQAFPRPESGLRHTTREFIRWCKAHGISARMAEIIAKTWRARDLLTEARRQVERGSRQS
jgi:hypothetical protein